MKNIVLLFCLLISVSLNNFGQGFGSDRFGNEWIKANQQYLKFQISSNGIYRITRNDLINAGFEITNKPLKNYQLYYRGIEMAVKVVGGENSDFGNSDYIEFFAKPNDGKQDEDLYKPKTGRHNEYYSIYSDFATYFLTSDNSKLGKRLLNIPSEDTSLPSERNFYITQLINFTNAWNFTNQSGLPPAIIQSYFEPGEGLCSAQYWNKRSAGFSQTVKPYNSNFLLINHDVDENNPAKIELLLTTRAYLTSKSMIFKIDNVPQQPFILGGWYTTTKLNHNVTSITANSIAFELNTPSIVLDDTWSIMYSKFSYPKLPIFIDNETYELNQTPANKSRLQLSNAPINVFGFDVTDFYNQNPINILNVNTNVNVYVDNTNTKRKVYLTGTTKTPLNLSVKVFNNIVQSDFNFLILTDSRLLTSANTYKLYRESLLGGGHRVFLSDMTKIYDQFSYGEINPIAIRRFLDFMSSTSSKMENFLIIGAAIAMPANTKLKELANLPSDTFVPTYGYPASDSYYSSNLNGYPEHIASIPTGRIPARTNDDVLNYLEKVVNHESRTESSWQKNMLHLAGPKSVGEQITLEASLELYRKIVNDSWFIGNPTNYPTINRTGNLSIGATVPPIFYSNVNSGVGIINYFGHGTSLSTWNNFGYVSGNNNYTNEGKYPLLIANGCGIGNGFDDIYDLATDWLITPKKGAINVISQTYVSYEEYDDRAMKFLYKSWFGNARPGISAKTNQMIYQPIGQILQSATLANITANITTPVNDSEKLISNLDQTMLFGDPSISILKDNTTQPLSLTLLNIKISTDNKSNEIIWETENEVNFKEFEIERSKDNMKFEVIGKVTSKGNNSKEIRKYQITDFSPALGINYYRLKMVDIDGTFEYSKILSVVNKNLDNKLLIFNNPIKNKEINFEISDLNKNSVELINLNGSKINYKLLQQSENTYSLKLSNEIMQGIYILTVKTNKGNLLQEKLVLY